MNLFPVRRRDAALSELKATEPDFIPIDELPEDDPEGSVEVSPANELATALVELDIAEAVRVDNSAASPTLVVPAPLSLRHLETIDRMVLHLKADEKRLEQQISDARRQLADTQLARRGFERNSAELRRGIDLLTRDANRPAARRKARAPAQARTRADAQPQPRPANDVEGEVTFVGPRAERKVH